MTNFYQDVSIDWEKGRIYIPQDELKKFKVEKIVFELKENNLNFKLVLEANVKRTEILFTEGRGLLKFLNGRLKYEIKWTILGGEEILNKIKKIDYDVFNQRPKLTKFDLIILFIKVIFFIMNDNAKEIAKKSKSSFYYAFNFLPTEKRDAMNTVYAFCRQTDDIIDEGNEADDIKYEKLRKWRIEFEKAFSGHSEYPLLNKLAKTISQFNIPYRTVF